MAAPTTFKNEAAGLREQLDLAEQRIGELQEQLERAEEVQQASTVLIIAALVQKLGGEVVLSNAELGAVSGELQSYETFGGRVFRLVDDPDDDEEETEDDEPTGFDA